VKVELGPDAQRRLGVPVRARGRDGETLVGRAALVSGLVPALRGAVGAGRLGGGHRRRPGAPVPGDGESRISSPPRACRSGGHRGGARGQQRRRWPPGGALRPRVHGARPRLREDGRRHRAASCSRPTGALRSWSKMSPRSRSVRRCAAASPTRRRRRRGGRHRGHAHGENALDVIGRVKAASSTSSSPSLPGRAWRWSPPTTARSSSCAPSTP
jgi:hypothetical protein